MNCTPNRLPEALAHPQLQTIFPQVGSKVGRLLLECSDYYLAHRTNTPKFTIGGYVDEEIQKDSDNFPNLKVPRRFYRTENGEKVSCHREATKSGVAFKARSEHNQDYDGISGLLETFDFAAGEEVDEEKLLKETRNHPRLIEYCKIQGLDINEFMKGVSFSYWEDVPGKNITVVRDENMVGRYHIFHNYDGRANTHLCIENGKKVVGEIEKGFSDSDIESLIQQYDRVQGCEKFDGTQCPNIEFQFCDNENIYFLQYKRGYQENTDGFKLDRELEKGEFNASFVRGATQKNGFIYSLKRMTGLGTFLPSSLGKVFDFDLLFNLKHDISIRYNWEDTSRTSWHGFVGQISHSKVFITLDMNLLESVVGEKYMRVFEHLNSLSSVSRMSFSKGYTQPLSDLALNAKVESDGTRAIIGIYETIDELIQRALDAGYPEKRVQRIKDQVDKKLF